jgi:PQQ-like domain
MRWKLALLLMAPQVMFDAQPAYRVLAADKGKVSLVDSTGKVLWSMDNNAEVHDIQMLANGNILVPTGRATVAEVAPNKTVVWSYTAKPKSGYTGAIEIHTCQRLDNGNTMIAESGNRHIVEVDKSGTIVHEVPLTVDKPNAHRDTRMVRKTAANTYLVCHEGDGKVREYDSTGKVIWEYALDLAGRSRASGHGVEGHGTEVFGAVRLNNGNTLIGGGNANRVIEVDRAGKSVWALEQKDLPGITLAWVTTLHVLPNGNIIVGNCHAGPENPQLIEVTRDKKVVWTFKDHQTFGNSLAAAHVLDTPAPVVR